MTKRDSREQARAMRIGGYSLSEIAESLNVSKSSASLWVGDITLSREAKRKISEKRAAGSARSKITRQANFDLKVLNARVYAKGVVSGVMLNADTSRLLCALLYWCEGAKMRRGKAFLFTNSDPALVSLFMKLFRQGFEIEEGKLRLNLQVHDYHDLDDQLRFWSKIATIPLRQCYKPYQKPHNGVRTREGYGGCVSIRYLDTELGRRLESIAIVFLEQGP